jgi:rhodanese-related sulfurtransferase
MQTVTIAELKSALDAGRATVLDVREPYEYESGHVPGAINIPMAVVPVRLSDVPGGSDVHVICESGARSWQVCSFLDRHGIPAINVDGGTAAWRMNGLPLEAAATAG